MTREQYLANLFDTYSLVSVLSNKNECKVLRLRNKKHQKDIVLHSSPKTFAAYEQLYHIKCANLPIIYDNIALDDGQIVLEEFIDGITVAQVMEAGRYHYRGAKTVLKSVCNALTVLHSHGIVHRDIKPENIIVTKSGRVVLVDFDASRLVKEASRDTVIMGTVGYASPEQLGVAQSDSRTDIYALGVLLNVMISGCHPSVQIAKGRVGKIVKKCTDISPDNRYQTATEFSESL